MIPHQTYYLVHVADVRLKPCDGVLFLDHAIAQGFARSVIALGRAVELRKSEVVG